MKNFFKKLIGKIYPQGVIGKNNNISDVYAGPDDMDNWKKKRKITGKVYAGPGMMKKDEMRCVYAGPEYFNKKKNLAEGVYAGPDMIGREREEVIECVYAGPPEDIYVREPDPSEMEDVYMGPPEDDPVDEDAPEDEDGSVDADTADEEPIDEEPVDEPVEGEEPKNTEDDFDKTIIGFDPSTLGAVYAGPEQMQDPNKFLMAYAGPSIGTPVQQPENMINNPNTMMVYAGPVQMQNPNLAQFMMAYAGPNMMNNAQLFKNAGMFNNGVAPQPMDGNDPADTVVNNDLNTFLKCPSCGTKCAVGQKFCNECGYMLKDVEVTNETKNE